ncbi:MAG: ABC transporter permease, partial [Clostridiales bacterium]|nr:ABC transporter permease [Clostridiales bacterium]
YAYLHAPEERMNANASVTLTNWDNNKDFLYTKLFVKTGFVTENFDASAGTLFISIFGNDGRGFSGLPIEPDKAVYNAQNFENPKTSKAFIWVDPNASEAHTMPDKTVQSFPRVAENQIVISRELIVYFLPELVGLIGQLEAGLSVAIPEHLLWVEMYGDGNGYRAGFGFQIVGIYDEANFEDVGSFAADSRIIQEITQMLSAQKAVRFNKVMFDRGGNFGAIERLAESLIAKDFLLYSSVGSTSDLLYIRDVFDTVSDVFLYISLGIAVFSFLMMLNYMSSSVRFRAKEIAVYRVVGAGRFDIIKIFLTEGTLLAVVSTILASLLAGVFAWIMDISFSASANIFNLSFTIISFNLLTVLAVFGAIALLVTLSSLIPVVSITRKKAIDALKVIG